MSSGRGPSLLLNSWGSDKLLWNLHRLGITIWAVPSCWAPLIPSHGIQLFVGARGTTNLEGNGRKRKRNRRPGRVPIKVSFIMLRCLLFKAYIAGNMGGVEGELYKEQGKGQLLTWGLKSGAKQQVLCILSPGTLILLNSLGSQAGLRRSSCPWMSWEEIGKRGLLFKFYSLRC